MRFIRSEMVHFFIFGPQKNIANINFFYYLKTSLKNSKSVELDTTEIAIEAQTKDFDFWQGKNSLLVNKCFCLNKYRKKGCQPVSISKTH